jgi:hypothetical protein
MYNGILHLDLIDIRNQVYSKHHVILKIQASLMYNFPAFLKDPWDGTQSNLSVYWVEYRRVIKIAKRKSVYSRRAGKLPASVNDLAAAQPIKE